jgi:hypothetical protein
MKHLIYTLFFLCSTMVIKAQEHCSFVVDETSTIEEFNWQATSFSVWFNRAQQEPINLELISPFFWPNIEQNISQFNEPATADKDFYEKDGWVALYRNFGTSNSGVDNPGFILYNRYEGILRVFIYLTETVENYNTATIDANLLDQGISSTKMSGLFSYIKGPVQALDNFDKNIEITVPNKWDNPQNGQWLHADIPIAYDPCTCDGHSSTSNPVENRYGVLDIYPALTDVSTIDFVYGKKVTEKKKVVENNEIFLPSNFKASINKLDATQKAGNKAYKGIAEFIDLTTKIVKVFEADTSKTKDNSSIKGVVELLGNLKKYGPEVGAIIAIVDFLVLSSNNAAATTSNTLFSASGTLTEQKNFDGLTFFLPGSLYPLGTSAIAGEPIYKNILGVFGILETPKVSYKKDTVSFSAGDIVTHIRTETYKVDSDLKYTLNPSTHLELTPNIKAALYFPLNYSLIRNNIRIRTNLVYSHKAADSTYYYRTPYLPLGCLNDFKVHFSVETADLNYQFPGFLMLKQLGKPVLQIVTKLSTRSDIQDYREVNLITKYTTNTAEVATLQGNNYPDIQITRKIENLTLTKDETIVAWEHVELGNNINTNGHKLTIVSGGDIELGEYEYNPNIELIIDYPIACDRIVPQQTAAQIATFCQDNNKYKPNFEKSYQKEVLSGREGNFAMLAYPNPFAQSSIIEFSLLENQNIVTLKLYDAWGREVQTIMTQVILPSGTYKRTISSNLPPGIYFALLQTDNGNQTIKLIKQ